MVDDTEVAALCAQLEAIIKKAEDAEAQAVAAQCHIQAARLLLEESKAAALEQTATSAPSARAIFFIIIFPSRGLVARSDRLFDLQRHGRHRTLPSGSHSAQRLPAGEHRPRLLLDQLRQLACSHGAGSTVLRPDQAHHGRRSIQ
jgi:hypothetical protein